MKPLVVVDSPKRWPLVIPGTELVSAYRYLSEPEFSQGRGRKVFNLCRSLRYQAQGYYVSLLAEARGHRPLPSVTAIQDFRLAPVVRLVSEELEELIQSSLQRIRSDAFELSVYFGRNLATRHDSLALAIFNAFPAPLLRAQFEHSDGWWKLTSVRVLGLAEVPQSHRPFVTEQAQRYLKRTPRRGRDAAPTRFDLAILHNPNDPMSPSGKPAMKRFIAAGGALGIRCELIEKDAYGRIDEYDGLFIRETTQVNHHTYRFARRAAAAGLVVIDDPASIVRCTNKVFLAETMLRHRLPTPRTLILSKDNALQSITALGWPCVLKLPDSAFSAGVIRVDSADELPTALDRLFADSELIIAQEYVPTDFDWRIGVLGREPLFACRYQMAPQHWQVINHGSDEEGSTDSVAVEDVPKDVMRLAVRAANLMGDGLYGVDLKVVRKKAVVIEVNDNPNIDHGIEDVILGGELYVRIMRHFSARMEAQ